LDRLNRSLTGIRMPPAMSHGDWAYVCQELISRNSADQGHLYMQVSRGAEFGRNHAWPEGLKPTLFAYCTELDPLPDALLENGVAAVTAIETRWARRDIKATALLANILLKKLAADAGAFETIMLENGELTEGSSTTVHVVKNGVIHTPPNSHHILPGTTRDVVTELADLLSVRNSTAAVSEAALRGADEVWLAFSTRGVLPVTKLDGAPVGNGVPGPLFKRIHLAFANYIRELAKTPAL
jgi:D-alanine transaminase